jgi:trans-aconitate methyltransferase
MPEARWFSEPGKPGFRSMALQKQGLEPLWTGALAGASVLDVGCAEGLISLKCLRGGAATVHGIDNRAGAIKAAAKAAADAKVAKRCLFEVKDASTYAPARTYDVVLLLAVLHKLRDPSVAFQRFLRAADETCVVRLPRTDWPVLMDARSENVAHNLALVAEREGFELAGETDGPRVDDQPHEWVGYFARKL